MILGFALVLTLLQVEVSFARPLNQADLNGLEQSVEKLQNFFHEVRATKQREFASQQHRPRCPITTNPQEQATPQAVHIQDKNSGKVLQYMPIIVSTKCKFKTTTLQTSISSGMRSSLHRKFC